ncbi:MAG: chemotaxis protein CheA, partial [Opitutales bacterium]
MPLSEDQIISCDTILNRIATELVLASAGSDDGLVPVYSLVNEMSGTVDTYDDVIHAACIHVRRALDELLDESVPFDARTLDYVNNFTSWAQDGLLAIRNGGRLQPFAPAPWMNEEDEADLSESEQVCNDIINRIATELVLANTGSDDGLVPMYSLTGELIDHSHSLPKINVSARSLKKALDHLLDNAKPFDMDTLGYAGAFVAWAQDSMRMIMDGAEQAVKVFEEFKEPEGRLLDSYVRPKPTHEPRAQAVERVLAPVPVVSLNSEVDVLLEINGEDQEILGEFHTEAVEHLENIEGAVLVLEQDPHDVDSLALIFRAFHTIKGVAGFLHLVPIQSLAHQVETLLDHARNAKLTLDTGMITLILHAKDTLQALVEQIAAALEKGHKPSKIVPVSHLITAVQNAVKDGLDIGAGRTPEVRVEAAAPVAEHPAGADEDEDDAHPQAAAAAAAAPAQKGPSSPQSQSSSTGAGASTIRVKTTKLDNLMDMVGELVIVQSQLTESSKALLDLAADNSLLQQNISQLQRITRELQHTSMSLRLVPIKPTFQKVSRMVRDIAGQVNKKVDFITEGEDTELDRNVVEQINDPLVHMIRNSLDHGLEDEAERLATKKSPVGKIILKAYHQGSSIVIELSDDGRGIDPARILKKAREKGLVREDQNPARADILNLIFEPGFSTAEKVSDISGRGVGMDVVRRNIEKLRGKVELESEIGKGTIFKIKLPLTTAIIDGLVVRVGQERFILPTTSVKVALRPEKSQISKIKGK